MGRWDPEGLAPTFRPSRAAFERPFCDYVRDIFKRHPDLPMFKVIPPKGWSPRKGKVDLDKVRINTPIKQHVFGKSGAYVCILEEQRGMTAAEFKKLSERPEHTPPTRGQRGAEDDQLRERSFWSGITNSPPLYGADTAVSLFDARLSWGWNLRKLGCMLQDPQYDVPNIPGVTSPMTYWGMYRSFFGWHKEDVDLYSINYLHFGAPKVWYCVSPKDNPKFDAMAEALFPDLHRNCRGFMRHKDIMISPKVLRTHNVPYLMAKQEAGEFIVLNAAAFHAGYNLGFNCAEAVNFAMEEWLDAGKAAVPCTCTCLPDGVSLDMAIFCPELRTSSDEEDDSEEEEGSDDSSEEGSDEGGSDEEEEEEEEAAPPRGRGRAAVRTPAAAKAAPRKRGRGAKAAATPEESSGSEDEEDSEDEGAARKRQRGAGGPLRAVPKLPEVVKALRAGDLPRGAAHAQWGKVAEERPLAVVERDERTKQLTFSLVHRLAKPSSKAGAMWVGLLKEGPDGLFRPQGASKLLQLGLQFPRIVRVRAEWVAPDAKSRQRAGGWALKTKQERILM